MVSWSLSRIVNWQRWKLVHHNDRLEFAPFGRWDLRFAAAPQPNR